MDSMTGDEREMRENADTAATSGASGQQAEGEAARRGRSQGRSAVELNMGGSETHQRPSFADPIPPGDPDGVAGGRDVPGHEADAG
jgi:hypothetical protein